MPLAPLQERRRSPRVKIHRLTYINLDSGNGGIVLDISQDGLGLQAVAPLESNVIRFRLSVESTDEVEALGELIWCDQTGKRGGLRFTYLPEALQREIGRLLGPPELISPRLANPPRAGSSGIHSIPASKQAFAETGPTQASRTIQTSVAYIPPLVENKHHLGSQREASLGSRESLPRPVAPGANDFGLNRLGNVPRNRGKTSRASAKLYKRRLRLRITVVTFIVTLGIAIGVSSFVYKTELGALLVRLVEQRPGATSLGHPPIPAVDAGFSYPRVPSDGPNPAGRGTSAIPRLNGSIANADRKSGPPGEEGRTNVASSHLGSQRAGARAAKQKPAVSEDGDRGGSDIERTRNRLRNAGADSGKISITPEMEAARELRQLSQRKQGNVPVTIFTPLPHDMNPASSETLVVVTVASRPEGAEVNVDDLFAGNAPITLSLKPGKHAIRMFMSGYHNWSQWITIEVGADVHITATLEKQHL